MICMQTWMWHCWDWSLEQGTNMAISMVNDELPGTLHELYEEGKYFIEKCFVKDPKKQWTFEGSSIYGQ